MPPKPGTVQRRRPPRLQHPSRPRDPVELALKGPISAVGRFSSAGGVADLQAAIAAGVAVYRAGAVKR
jgi:hypothetical protein